jgi:signal transduction histidine kinase
VAWRVIAGFFAAVASIVVAVAIYFTVVAERQAHAARVAETSETILSLQRLEGLLWQAESGHRGYLLTRDDRYLEPYERAAGDIGAALEIVKARVARESRQRVRSERLAILVDAKLADMRRGLVARDEQGLRQALRVVQSDEGLGLMGLIEGVLREMEAVERDALGTQQLAWFGSIALADAVFVGANLLLLALIAVAAIAVRGDTRAREERQRERERMLEIQERLLAIVGHDLRSPLSAIEAGVTLLSRAALGAPEARTAARVLSSSRRMTRMIRDLLDWTRVRSGGGIPLSRRKADLGEICRGVLDEVSLRAGPGVELTGNGDLSGRWDPDRLQQAFGNVVTNALRYAPAGAPVRIRAIGEPDRVRLEIENDGPPIPPEVMRSLFEPYRAGAAVGEHGGVGLGLFIVRSIVEAHGGTIAVDSGPSRPVRFTVSLPRDRRGGRGASASPPPGRGSAHPEAPIAS